MIKKKLTAILLFVFLSGCSGIIPYKKDILLMDTFLRVEIRDNLTISQKREALDNAIKRMKELEGRFNYYKKESELAKINRLEKDEEFLLSDEMFKVLRVSQDLHTRTKEAFDVTLGTGAWRLDEAKKAISFAKEGVKINLGGIAKGFIVDEGIRILKECGVRNALITAGGDMYCMGEAGRGEWRIGIRSPEDSRKVIATFGVRDKGVATSGTYERGFHIIDPRTGYPVEKKLRSATVVANDCITADALATALFVLGPQEGLAVIESIPDAECVIVDEGEIYCSSGLKLSL